MLGGKGMGGMGGKGGMGMGGMGGQGCPFYGQQTALVPVTMLTGGAIGMNGFGIHMLGAGNLFNSPSMPWACMKPGDWVCPNPNCGDIQFERNTQCRKCGMPKPVMSSNKQV